MVALFSMVSLFACSSNRRPDTVANVEPRALVLKGATVLKGRELTPLEDTTLVVEDGVIAAIGPPGEIDIPADARTVDAAGLLLAPGFIDAHVHIGFYPPPEVLAGGVTTVRDLGWPPEKIFPLVAQSASDSFEGPTIVAAGPMITVPDGYPTTAGWAPEGTGRPVVSAEEALTAVKEAQGQGAAVIKVALNPPAGPTLSAELLAEIVETAHRLGLKVTAHIYGLEELEKAIAAGVDELAHMLMSSDSIPDATLQEMVAGDMAIVPTLAIRGADRAVAIDNLERFLGFGGRVIYGTDLGNAGPSAGIDPSETEAMGQAGMAAIDIVRSATVESAAWLGLDGVGVLAPGRAADIVGFDESALQDIGALAEVRLVIRRGRVVAGG